MLNPTPKTSHGVKLRRNSKALILHQYPSKRIRSFVLGNLTPCLYPSLANSAASWSNEGLWHSEETLVADVFESFSFVILDTARRVGH